MSNSKPKLLSNKGFTLVEIMIVMAILGSIFALLAPRFTGAKDKANIKEAKIQMSLIMNALTAYETDCGKYPSELSKLQKADAECTNWGPKPYYTNKLLDPWGHPFYYELNGGEYILKSFGKDGKEGGSEFAKDIPSDEGSEGTKE